MVPSWSGRLPSADFVKWKHMSDALQQRRMLEAATMWRVSWRIMPFLTLAYLLCYIDRVNVGFASLQMNKAVGIDPSEQPESDLRARWNPLWRFRLVSSRKRSSSSGSQA